MQHKSLVLSVPAFIYFSVKVANIYDIDLGLYLTALGLIRLWYGILPATREALHSFWKNILLDCQGSDTVGICGVYSVLLFPILCFCLPIGSSPLSCFIEIEVLITAQANLELTECLRHGIPRKPTKFPMKYRRSLLFYFLSVFATTFYHFMIQNRIKA